MDGGRSEGDLVGWDCGERVGEADGGALHVMPLKQVPFVPQTDGEPVGHGVVV